MDDKDRLGADEIYRVFPFGRNAVEIAVARIRAEAVAAERERVIEAVLLMGIIYKDKLLKKVDILTALYDMVEDRVLSDTKEAHRG